MRILIVRACAIGDFVLNLPALRSLAVAHPAARFTLVGYPQTLSLARTFIPVDAIHSIETQPWASLFTGPLDGLAFDTAWVWMKDSTVADNLRRSGIPEVFHSNPFPPVRLPDSDLPDLWHPASTRVILHPGSGGAVKVWPRFEELAQSLPDATVLLGPCESPLSTPNSRIENLPLLAAVEEIRNCRVFIGNDSGMTHIAAYWGIPTVALFGPTDPKMWGPVGRRVKILHKPSLLDISVDDVRKLL